MDDRPENNAYERNMLGQYGIKFSLALSTSQALRSIRNNEFSLIISDMVREEGESEGYVLLDEVRKNNKEIPFIFYIGSGNNAIKDDVIMRGGQGCTDDPRELIDLVVRYLLNR